jgi:hypothetical protein
MSNITKIESSPLEKYKEYASFIRDYGQRILSIDRDYKNPTELFELVDALPDDLPQKDALYDVLKRLDPERKGILSERAQSFHTDLRLFHGTGNDPNRPQDLVPGEMYYSAGTDHKIGKEFIGTPLFIWEGREYAEKAEPGATPKTICLSHDRKMGTAFGECQKCHYLPWRPGADKSEMTCKNNISAFMLAQDGREIVLVRFARTSEGAGRQLLKFAGRTPQLWYRWYSIKPVPQVSADKKIRWFVYTVETVSGPEGVVPAALHPLCDAFYCAAGRDYVFPSIARCYADIGKPSADAHDPVVAGTATVATAEADKGFGGYGEINEDA